jgi:hypothetical protein
MRTNDDYHYDHNHDARSQYQHLHNDDNTGADDHHLNHDDNREPVQL